jgi:hypothetical protein
MPLSEITPDPDLLSCLRHYNNDSRHIGGSNNNIVSKRKQENDSKHFFNCSNSSDLALIKNCW